MQILGPRLRRLLPWGAVVGLAAATVAAHGRLTRDPAVVWLPSQGPAAWIIYPMPGDPTAHPQVELDTVFRRELSLAARPPQAFLHVRALRRYEVRVNRQLVAATATPRSWKIASAIDVAPWLGTGENEIEVRVSNHDGPPALWAALDLPGGPLVTDDRWLSSWAGATWRPAALASSPAPGRRFDVVPAQISPARALAKRWPTLLALAALAAFLAAAAQRVRSKWPNACTTKRVTYSVAGVAACLWGALFVNNCRWLDPTAGFDAKYHLAYIQYVVDHASLPAANDSWQAYQAPLYYVVGAALLKLIGSSVTAARGVCALRMLGLACGIANVFLVAACMRRLFRQHPRRQVLGTVFAAFLPCQLYLFQFPTNELLLVTLSSATLLVALGLLEDSVASWRRHLLLGACAGLALLAKASALLFVLPVLVVLAVQAARRPADRRWSEIAKLVAGLAVTLLICAWHYGYMWTLFGNPLAGNWDDALGQSWWQEPGYRTWHDYLRFGHALVAPLFAGFESVPDGLYATLWGDGLVAGFASVANLPWSADLMAMGYLVALLPGAAVVAGGATALVGWLRRPGARGLCLGGVVVMVLAGMFVMTLKVPSYAQAKAFYGLSGLIPLSACAAVGLDLPGWGQQWRKWAGPIGLATWALLGCLALWIVGTGPELSARGTRLVAAGESAAGLEMLRRAALDHPADWAPRLALARILIGRQHTPEAVRPWLELGNVRPDVAGRHFLLASVLRRHERVAEALSEARQGLALDADSLELHTLAAEGAASQGDFVAAVREWRETLRIAPHSSTAHAYLGRLLEQLGRPDEAAQHQAYAARLLEGR